MAVLSTKVSAAALPLNLILATFWLTKFVCFARKVMGCNQTSECMLPGIVVYSFTWIVSTIPTCPFGCLILRISSETHDVAAVDVGVDQQGPGDQRNAGRHNLLLFEALEGEPPRLITLLAAMVGPELPVLETSKGFHDSLLHHYGEIERLVYRADRSAVTI